MKLLFALSALATAGTAQALEFGVIRPLQHGPIGDSPQFTDIDEYAGEAAVVMSRTWGKYTINDDNDQRVSASSFKTRIATGGGWAPTKQLTLTGYVDFTLASDYDEEQKRGARDSTLDTGPYQHEFALFGIYKARPLVFGGGLSLKLYGAETREFVYEDGATKSRYFQEVGSAAMPVLRLFGGISTKDFEGTLGLRLFSKGDAEVVARDKEDGTKLAEYDVVRRNPGEIHLDGRINFGSASLAGSLAYLLQSQASEQVDEWSVRYATQGTSKVRQTAGGRRNSDQFKIGVGGRFDPTKMFGLLGGLSYLSSSYESPEYASIEHENLGGIRLDLGTEVKIQKFNGSFHAGYQMDSSASATIKDDQRTAANLERSQRFPINKGDRVKTSQGRWDLALGGGVTF